LVEVVIGENITSIPDYSFGECPILSIFALPSAITAIGANAFYNDSNL